MELYLNQFFEGVNFIYISDFNALLRNKNI